MTTYTVTLSQVGMQGPKGANWRGTWATGLDFIVYDVVHRDGSTYICTKQHTSAAENEPSVGVDEATYWEAFTLSGSSAAAVDAANSAAEAATSESNASDSADEAEQDAIATAGDRVQTGLDRTAAENARDAAFANSGTYATTADGIAATVDGDTFVVPVDGEIVAYRNDAGSAVAIDGAVYPAAETVAALPPTIGSISAILGQAYEEIERLSETQQRLDETQQGRAYTLNLVFELASLIGALSGQINGGQATLRGGTLADPALRIGTAGIYSSAADTLSIAIAGSEVARFTGAGVTIYGTVTETP